MTTTSTTKPRSLATGLVERTPAQQLARQTLDDLERLGHGLSLLAHAARRVGDEQLRAFALDAEDALTARSELLRALMPEVAWTGP